MTVDDLSKYLESLSLEVEILRKHEKIKLLKRWKERYIAPFEKLYDSAEKSWDLHIFENNLLPCITDTEAEKEYSMTSPERCYILPSDDGPGFVCSSKPPADLSRFCLEGARPWPFAPAGNGRTLAESFFLISPASMNWTFVVHAEGSYFAMAPEPSR